MKSESTQQTTDIYTQKLRECFNEFAEDLGGSEEYAYVSQLPSMIEYLHYPLPENFVEQIYIQFRLKDNQKFNFNKFCEFLAPRHRKTKEWEKLHDAFEVFDNNGNGKISVSELSEILSTFGNIFTTEEINHMKAITKPDENDLIDINLITDLLIDDMFDNLEEEEEEEYAETQSNTKQSNAKQNNNDKMQSMNSYQQSNEYQEHSNEYQQQSNEYPDQSNEYQDQSNEYQQQSNEYQQQSNEYQELSNEYPEQGDGYPEQGDYQDQYIEEEEEEVND